MILTISTTRNPATALSWLLHKRPDKVQSFPMPQGNAYVFYPEISDEKTTVALLLDIDTVGLVRKKDNSSFALEQYVNDRPYAANSYLSTALARVFSSALNGICKERPELTDTLFPLEITIPALYGGEKLIRQLFEPLGYTVDILPRQLDDKFPEWGESPYSHTKLTITARLCDALRHLFILIPALDNKKHYWIGEDEIQKLIDKGEGWLAAHPARELIAGRYLRLRSFKDTALELLSNEEDEKDEGEEEDDTGDSTPLWRERLEMVTALLLERGAESVIDLGCGDGKYIQRFLREGQFKKITGMDVSLRSLRLASGHLNIDELYGAKKERVTLFQGSLMYRDKRIAGYDAAIAVEVMEHIDPDRLKAFEEAVFKDAASKTVIITTPNKEYNALYSWLNGKGLRYSDHRFEMSRSEFKGWAEDICGQYGYSVSFEQIGASDSILGAPTQLALFNKGN